MKGWFVAAIGIVIAAALYLMSQANSNSAGNSSGGFSSGNSQVDAFAQAISVAENVPASANNPGALVLGDQGNGLFNSAGVTIFASIEDGWSALFKELNLVAVGQILGTNS